MFRRIYLDKHNFHSSNLDLPEDNSEYSADWKNTDTTQGGKCRPITFGKTILSHELRHVPITLGWFGSINPMLPCEALDQKVDQKAKI